MKYALAILVFGTLIALAAFLGSGYLKRQVALYTGYSTICVDGVRYIQFTSGASVKYNTDGTIVRCD